MVRWFDNPDNFRYLNLNQQSALGVVDGLQEGHLHGRGGHVAFNHPRHAIMNFVNNSGYSIGQEFIYPQHMLQYYPSIQNAGDTYLLLKQ